MADGYISQIKTPDNKIYDFRDQHLKVYTGSCTTAAGTAIKDVTTDGEFTLAKGAVIFVNFSTTNTAAVANLKLRVNSNTDTDAKPIKHQYNASESNLPGVGYIRANQTYAFYYDGTNWIMITDYNTNDNDTSRTYERYNHTRLTCTTTFPRYSLAFTHATDSTKVIPVNSTENNVTDTKSTITTEPFNIFEKIYYKSDAPSTVLAANSLVAVGVLWYAYSALDLRYSFNLTTTSLTAHKDVYLVCSLVTPTTATLRGASVTGANASTLSNNQGPITQTLPSSEDNLIYIKLGRSYSAYQITLTADHPIYWYKDGAIRLYTGGRSINNITRSGTTFTATRDDGSTFTFTQQDNAGITSVTIGATSPVQSSTSTAQTGSSASTTISLKDAYGDTKNPYGTKAKNLVLAGPSSGNNAAPDFRALVATDIPDLSWNKITSNKPTTLSGYGITDAKIVSGIITLGSDTITPVTSVNGHTGNSVNVTAADLGLSNALHFIGITSTTLADESTTTTLTPKSTNSLSKTTGFVDGDVVMDGDQLREYVWSEDAWRLLGITTSTTYKQPASTATNTWIAQISQGTDGKITATTGSLNTSGTWSGTASKATTTANTTDTLYLVGVKSSATSTLLHDTSITVKGNTLDAGIIKLHQGNAANPSLTGNARIEFDYSNGQPVVISYTPNDTYRAPAGLKIMGGTSASPAWLEVEGDIYAAAFKGNADTASSAAKLTTARTITLDGEISGTANFDGSDDITITTASNTIITIQKTLTVTDEWQDTGILYDDLATGTYIIQMSGFSSNYIGQYGEIYSGVLTWYASETNSSDYDDIWLHKAGHASNGKCIFLRTARRSRGNGNLKLEIKGSHSATSDTTITFKFRRMI